MSWLSIISGVIQLIMMVVSAWLENNSEIKKKKEELIQEMADAIKTNDPSRITAVFDKLR